MASITSWSSTTTPFSPPARPDRRETTDFSTLEQDGSGGMAPAALAALLDKGVTQAASDTAPLERTAEEGGWAGMRMDTQSFATMMQGPPPPPSISAPDGDDNGPLTAEEFGMNSSSDDDENDRLNTIDADGGGDLSVDEAGEFEEKMRTLFSRLQQMGTAEYESVANATTRTNDANLNLSA